MNSLLTTHQNNLISEIAENGGISDYDLEVKSVSIKGDGYMGIISTVDIIGDGKKLSLVLKTADTNEELRKKVVIRKAYLREIHVYKNILPALENFQKNRSLRNSFNAFAKYYGGCEEDCKEFLFLENIKENGYKLWDRKIPMNSEHVALVFTQYGKFHAASLAMREKDVETFKELTKDFGNIFKDSYPKDIFVHVVKTTIDKGFNAVKGDVNATQALERFSHVAVPFLMDQLELPEDSIVINHGDCWCNNMMFKYADNRNPQKPTDVCLLDWQLAKLGSPVLDLAYFFFVCSSKDVLYDYKKYLNVYYETVSENLRQLSCDPEKIFPYSLLESHWKKYAKFGLYMALVIIKLMLSEADEVPVLNDIANTKESIFDGFNYDVMRITDYNQRISDVINFMAEHDLI